MGYPFLGRTSLAVSELCLDGEIKLVQRMLHRAAVATAALVLTAGGLGISATAASAATTTAPPTTAVAKAATPLKPLTSQHACSSLGSDGTTQAVFCADLVQSGTVFYAKAEGVCETISTGGTVQCSDINVSFAAFDPTGAYPTGGPGICGHSYGPCPTGRYEPTGPSYQVTSGCVELWTVVAAGSTIRLPGSGITKTLSKNLGSGHTTICA